MEKVLSRLIQQAVQEGAPIVRADELVKRALRSFWAPNIIVQMAAAFASGGIIANLLWERRELAKKKELQRISEEYSKNHLVEEEDQSAESSKPAESMNHLTVKGGDQSAKPRKPRKSKKKLNEFTTAE